MLPRMAESNPRPPPSTTRRIALELAFLVVLVWPVFQAPYFPSVDGPAHLAIAHILTSLLLEPESPFAQFYTLDLGPHPNLLVYALLIGLQQLLPPLAAEKVLLVGLAATLWLALRYAMAGIGATPAVLLTMLVLFNQILYLGFYNFLFGLVLWAAIVGLYLRHGGSFHAGWLAAGAALFCLAYLTHPTSLAVSGLTLGLLSVGQLLSDSRRTGFAKAWRRLFRRAAWIAAIALPAVLLGLAWMLPRLGGFGAGLPRPADDTTFERFRLFLSGAWLSVTPGYAAYVGLAWMTTVFVVLVLGWRRLRLAPLAPYLMLTGGLLALFLAVPYQLGILWMPERIAVYLYASVGLSVGAVLAAAIADGRQRSLAAAVTGGAVLCLGLGTFARLDAAARLAPFYDEVMAAIDTLGPGETVLALALVDPAAGGAQRLAANMLVQGGAYAVFLKQSLDAGLYQAGVEFFPVRFKAAADGSGPWNGPGGKATAAPQADLEHFEARFGRPLDRIVLFGLDANGRWPERHGFSERIARQYELGYVSSPQAFARVYRRR
jgi:hypothetical protein